VRPTSLRLLAALALGAAAVTWLLARSAYGDFPAVPGSAPVPLALVAVAELALARVVRDRVRRRPRAERSRPLHPLQVARAAALAKASSPAGALLAGVYGGLLLYTAPRADALGAAADDVLPAALAGLAAAGLVVAALLLERACRVPDAPDDGLGSAA
jgi:hypothetical protein